MTARRAEERSVFRRRDAKRHGGRRCAFPPYACSSPLPANGSPTSSILGMLDTLIQCRNKRRRKHGGTLHLRGGSLPARQSAAIHPLLSLPLVPAPSWRRLRGERDD